MRRIEREFDVRRRRPRDLAELLAVDRRGVVEISPLDRGHPLAADEIVVARADGDIAAQRFEGLVKHLGLHGRGGPQAGQRRFLQKGVCARRRAPTMRPWGETPPASSCFGIIAAHRVRRTLGLLKEGAHDATTPPRFRHCDDAAASAVYAKTWEVKMIAEPGGMGTFSPAFVRINPATVSSSSLSLRGTMPRPCRR